MAKKPGFTADEHTEMGDGLAALQVELSGWTARARAALANAAPAVRAADKVEAALLNFRQELELVAHRDRLHNSQAIYHLDALPVSADATAEAS